MKKQIIFLIGIVLLLLTTTSHAFFWKSKKTPFSDRNQKSRVAGQRQWLAGAYVQAGSLFAHAAAGENDPQAVLENAFMVQAASFYAQKIPSYISRVAVATEARALLENAPESPFTPIVDALQGEQTFYEQKYDVALRPLLTATENLEFFAPDLAQILSFKAAYTCLHTDEAALAYTRFTQLAPDTIVADYRGYWRGKAALMCDSTVKAILILEKVIAQYPKTLLYDDIQWLLGDAYMKHGSFAQAKVLYTKLATLKRMGNKQHQARYLLGVLHENQKLFSAAEKYYLKTMRYAPGTKWGQRSCNRLLALLEARGDSLEGRGIYYNGKVFAGMGLHQEALVEYERYLSRYPRSPILSDVLLDIARSYFKMDMFAEAEKRFVALRKKYKKGGIASRAALYIARCHKEAEHGAEACAAYTDFQHSFPKHSKAAEALWYVAWTHEMAQEYALAIKVYRNVASRYRKHSFGKESLWRIGFCHYKSGAYEDAIASFRTYGKSSSAARQDKARFWMARTRFAQKEMEKGTANMRLACKNYPRTYYSIRATSFLDSTQLAVLPDTGFDGALDVQALADQVAADMLHQHLSGEDIARVYADLHKHPRYRVGVRLLELGLIVEAKGELRRVERAFKNNVGALLSLYRLYLSYGVYDRVYRTAYRVLGRIHKSDLDGFPLDDMRLMFPLAHYGAVIAATDRYPSGPGPYLTYAVMHRESAFNPQVVSSAGAVGLMQIMPQTGKTVAAQLNELAFSVGRLKNPETSIRLGTSFLAGLLTRYKGDRRAVLASYNAGPHNVDMWMQQIGGSGDPDRFVEELDYRETRIYVQKVLRNARIYHALWDVYCRK